MIVIFLYSIVDKKDKSVALALRQLIGNAVGKYAYEISTIM